MRKIFHLYTNEITKITKKVSVFILAIIMILGVFAFGGVVKFAEYQDKKYAKEYSQQNDKYIEAQVERDMNDAVGAVEELNKRLTTATEEEKYEIKTQLVHQNAQLEAIKIAKENNVRRHTNTYLSMAVDKMQEHTTKAKSLELAPKELLSKEDENTILKSNEYAAKYLKIVQNKSYDEYIKLENEVASNNTALTEDEKKIEIDGNNLLLKADPTGASGETKDLYGQNPTLELVNNIKKYKKSLLNNIDIKADGTPIPLTEERKDEITNQISALTYKAENAKTASTEQYPSLALTGMFGFGMFIIVILVVILAGGAISSEISTGSIKSLIISPTKRWKIYLAKLLSVLSVGIVLAIILYGVVMAAFSMMFGSSAGASYIYASGGIAHELNFFIYRFLILCVDFIDIIIYLVFALMLSIITKNTAASVGISIAAYFGGNMALSVVQSTGLLSGEWLNFIPFSNMALSSRIFGFDASMGMMSGMGGMGSALTQPSIMFSICYLIVLTICMIYVGLDSFNRRDIK
ncbi:MAG: ABC transporter permease subunit [Clostridia bacterium]